MKIIIVGAHGQLGRELLHRSRSLGWDPVPLDLPQFDITDRAQVKNAVEQTDAALVINAAAYTAVDRAETEPDIAFAVNRDGPSYLAEICAAEEIPLVHISTDYVFDGNKKGAYVETDPVCPLGIYGKSKAAGEGRIREILPRHIIVRTAWLYGVHGHNFVKTMIRLAEEREQLKVVMDQHGCPTYAGDLADALLNIVDQLRDREELPWGTYHYGGRGETTWHGFASRIISSAGRHKTLKVKAVEPVPTSAYPTPARRPVNSILDCSLVESRFGVCNRPWQEGLEDMIACLFQTSNEDNAL